MKKFEGYKELGNQNYIEVKFVDKKLSQANFLDDTLNTYHSQVS